MESNKPDSAEQILSTFRKLINDKGWTGNGSKICDYMDNQWYLLNQKEERMEYYWASNERPPEWFAKYIETGRDSLATKEQAIEMEKWTEGAVLFIGVGDKMMAAHQSNAYKRVSDFKFFIQATLPTSAPDSP